MRKIICTLGLLFVLWGAAWAQPTNLGEPLITESSQITSPFSDEKEGTNIGALCDFDFGTFWHSDYHDKVKGDYHWVQFEFKEMVQGNMLLWIKRRNNDADHVKTVVLTGALTPDFIGEIPIDTLELTNAVNAGECLTDIWTIPTPVKYIRFTVIDAGGSVAFRKYWHAAEINFYNPKDENVLWNQMIELLNNYDEYLWDYGAFQLGTEPGQYADKASADGFYESLKKVEEILAAGFENIPACEEIRDLLARTKDYWAAYKASQNPFMLPADGYYRVISNLEYYEDVETGEVDEFGQPVLDRVRGIKKSLYAKLEGTAAWHTLDLEDCRDVWYIAQNSDTSVTMINAATEMGFWKIGSPVKMHEDKDTICKMHFDWAGKENDRHILYIRRDSDEIDGSAYLHQESHSRGAGESGNICGWRATFNMGVSHESDKGTSEWYLEPVPEEEAKALIEAYAPIKDHDMLVLQYREISDKARAAMAIAQEATYQELITKNEQFSSPVTETKEGSLNNLLDGNSDTFWHSNYADGSRPGATHFIDVTLDEPFEGKATLWVQRRAASNFNDNPTVWNIYGSNDEASLQVVADFVNGDESAWPAQTVETWTLIEDSLHTPWTQNVKEVVSAPFSISAPYKYLRFVCMECKGPNEGTRGYFHLGGFQINKIVGTPQIEAMGEIGVVMQAELAKADTISDINITIEDLNRIKAAYEAFGAILKDPTELRNAIKTYADYSKMLVIGEDPGNWASDEEAVALDNVVAAAAAYDKSGVYEQAELDDYVAAIRAAADAFMDAANKVSPNIWYRLRFPVEETYTRNGWGDGNVLQADGSNTGNLWGQYAAVANFYNTGEYEGNSTIETIETEAMREGNGIYFTEEDNIENEDASLFRFVSVGDTAYVIQNKATGLYINCLDVKSNDVTMSLNPTTFRVTVSGYGCMLLAGKSLSGESKTNLHAQCVDHRLVTWESSHPSTNSGLCLEAYAEVMDDAANAFVRDLEFGRIYPVCHPAGVKSRDESLSFYTVAGTYQEGENYFVALNKIAQTEPGVPCLAIVGSAEDYVESETPVSDPYILEQTGAGFAARADSVNGLVGTYDAMTAAKGTVVFNKNRAATAEDKIIENEDGTFTSESNRRLPAYSAFLRFGFTQADAAGTYDLVLQIQGEPTAVGIQETLQQVVKSGNLYDLNGRLLRSGATLNDVKMMGSGLYILNGVKIRVK